MILGEALKTCIEFAAADFDITLQSGAYQHLICGVCSAVLVTFASWIMMMSAPDFDVFFCATEMENRAIRSIATHTHIGSGKSFLATIFTIYRRVG